MKTSCPLLIIILFSACNMQETDINQIQKVEFDFKHLNLRALAANTVSYHSCPFEVKGKTPVTFERCEFTCGCVRIDGAVSGKTFSPGRHEIKLRVDTTGKNAVSFGMLFVVDSVQHILSAGGVVTTEPRVSPAVVSVSSEMGYALSAGKLVVVRTTPPSVGNLVPVSKEIEVDGLKLRLSTDQSMIELNNYKQQVARQEIVYLWERISKENRPLDLHVKIPLQDSNTVRYVTVPFSFSVSPPFLGLSDSLYLGTLESGAKFSKEVRVKLKDGRYPKENILGNVQVKVDQLTNGDWAVITFSGTAPITLGEFTYEVELQITDLKQSFRIALLGNVSDVESNHRSIL